MHLHRMLKTLLLLCAIALLGACSSGFVYNNADWWINWYINDYVKFNRQQQARFDQHVDQQMLWHRSSQLPRYEQFLQAVRRDVAGDLSVPQVRAHFATVYGFWRDFVGAAIPAMTQMLADIDDAQARQFMSRVEKDSAEFEAEYVKPDTRTLLLQQTRSTEKNAKKWIGPLTDRQRQIIRDWAASIHHVYPASLQQRLRWQQALADALHHRRNQAQLQTRLQVLFVDPSQFWSDNYRAMIDANEILTAQLLVDLHRSLTVNQRKHLFAVIDDYLADLQQLQGPAGQPLQQPAK